MDAEEIRNYVLEKDEVTETFPFGEGVLVFKKKEKIFLLLSLKDERMSINLKCDPNRAVELREKFPEIIIPGYHMNKTHWNTVFPEALKKDLVIRMIDDSYDLVSRKKIK